MWFGKCSGKQELHIKIGRDMWWFLNDFGIGKPPSFSSRNSVERRPIVKNLGRFLLSKCDNRHSKIFVLGGNSNIYLPRNLRFSRARWGGLKMYRLTPEATGCFSHVARSHPLRKIPVGKTAGNFTLHTEGPPGVPTDWNFKDDCYLLYLPPKKVSKDLGYFKNYALLNLLKLCKLYGRCKIQGAKTYLIWLQLKKMWHFHFEAHLLQTVKATENMEIFTEGWFVSSFGKESQHIFFFWR